MGDTRDARDPHDSLARVFFLKRTIGKRLVLDTLLKSVNKVLYGRGFEVKKRGRTLKNDSEYHFSHHNVVTIRPALKSYFRKVLMRPSRSLVTGNCFIPLVYTYKCMTFV